MRNEPKLNLSNTEYFLIDDISTVSNYEEILFGVDVIVHTAARVHIMNDTAINSLDKFRKINVQGTLSLANAAAKAGVKRLIFLSSIKVNGEDTQIKLPFSPNALNNPKDSYGISKMEAELGLTEIAKRTGMEVVIIRPPLVYGPGVKANFRSMMYWLARGIPLPLGAIRNLRSLVSIDNLVDLIILCFSHPAAANQIFMVSDGEDISTPELLNRIGLALKCPVRLFSVPLSLLKFSATVVGQGAAINRLCQSLQVDISKTQLLLDWNPPLSLDDGLRKTVERFLCEASS